MISCIVYGRNDSYGYNLHKRAALSLNSLGSHLNEPGDEIVFVDYNTPDGFPTFPEAIWDTLTAETRSKLRILRVTEDMHSGLKLKSHLKTLEPIARNIAVRKSNPSNNWILSTNTDVIVVSRTSQTLSEIVSSLPAGHYGLPRFEIPEGLWEGLDRRDPERTQSQLAHWGSQYHLNQISRGHSPHKFDAPGDFQLILREDLFDINGFDESMTRGWHVDSNLAKRLSFKRGEVKDLSNAIFIYHCDHTRQETPMHAHGARQNSIYRYVESVKTARLSSQENEWGKLADKVIELGAGNLASHRLMRSLEASIASPQEKPAIRRYTPDGFDKDRPSDEALMPFLLDLLLSYKEEFSIFWLGRDSSLPRLIQQSIGSSSSQINLEFSELSTSTSAKFATNFDWTNFDWVVLDFRNLRGDTEATIQDFLLLWWKLLMRISMLRSSKPLRESIASPKVLGIDVVNTSMELVFSTLVHASRTPYTIGIRFGPIAPFTIPIFFRFLLAATWTKLKQWKLKYFPEVEFLTRVAGFIRPMINRFLSV